MVSIRLEISRVFGEFWWRRREGWPGRFVESRAYPVVVNAVAAGGLAVALAMLGFAAFDRSVAALAWSVIVVAAYLLTLALLTSFGASAAHSAKHDAQPAEVLARCRKLLERHDFRIQSELPHGILAARGAGAGAESKWRNCPLEVLATVASSDGAIMLAVRCTGESGTHRFVRRLIARTAEAVASLDHTSLKALGKTLVIRPGRLFQRGLGSIVLVAMLICAVLSTAVLAAVAYRLATYVLDITLAGAAAEEMRRMQFQLTSGIDAALRTEVDRLAGMAGKIDGGVSRAESPADRMRVLSPSDVAGEFVAGVVGPEGKVSLIHPTGSGRPDAHWTPDVLNEARRHGLVRFGDRVFRELPQPQARELESNLGLKAGQLMIGASLTYSDLARLAPERMGSGTLEITFFDSGRPYLRYTWGPGQKPQVDGGSANLPTDVVAGAANRLDTDWTTIFRDVLFAGDLGGTAIRIEKREGAPYRVFYNVTKNEGAKGGWDGMSVAQSYDPRFEAREWILPLTVALALFALLPILIVTVALANLIYGRISRPALQIRDALRSLGEGDYSVRIEPTRSDEIGQIQAQLNNTAGELAKREHGT